MVRLALWAVILVVVVGLVVLDRVWPANARDVAWVAGTGTVPDDEADVVRRYLGRHRRHRMVGGLFGVVAAAVAGIRISGDADLAILLFGGLGGVLVGTLSAETYRLGPQPGTTSVASLEPHDPAPLPGAVRAARLLLAASVLGAGAMALWGHDAWALVVAAAGAVATAVAEATRARIVGRRRPVLSQRARQLDTRLREFAGRSVANLQLAATLLVAEGVLLATPSAGIPEAVRALGGLVAFVLAVVHVHRAAPRPPITWRQPA